MEKLHFCIWFEKGPLEFVVLFFHSFRFQGMRHMRNHLMASQGFCVVSIDSRGSCNRGTVFESHLKNRMGQVELNDQVEVLSWLASQKSYLDLKRVAIHGWSYGGYLSLMGLVKFPNLFKVLHCVFGALCESDYSLSSSGQCSIRQLLLVRGINDSDNNSKQRSRQ